MKGWDVVFIVVALVTGFIAGVTAEAMGKDNDAKSGVTVINGTPYYLVPIQPKGEGRS